MFAYLRKIDIHVKYYQIMRKINALKKINMLYILKNGDNIKLYFECSKLLRQYVLSSSKEKSL